MIRRDSLDVQIKIAIRQKRDNLQAREEVIERINAWAAPGGYLTLNYKPGRRLRVRLQQAIGGGDPWEHTGEFTLTFRAYGIPFWEQENAASVSTGTAGSASASMYIDGSAETVANVELANQSGATINSAEIIAGACRMRFLNLGMGGSESLVIDHDAEGLLRIRIRNGNSYRSAMAKREPGGSADDLFIAPGNRSFSFTAQRACRMTVSVRGRYL